MRSNTFALLVGLAIACPTLVQGACSTYNGHLSIYSVGGDNTQFNPGYSGVCVFLAPKSCPSPSVKQTPVNYWADPLNTNRTGGSHVAWLGGGYVDFFSGGATAAVGDLTGNVWKLYQNYPGTLFASAAYYQIRTNGGTGAYFWDGPLAGGTGLVKAGTAPTTASGITGAPTNFLVLCTTFAFASASSTTTASIYA